MPMAVIPRKLPFFDKARTVAVGTQLLRVKSYQIIVWVSLAGGEWDQLERQTPRFPAVLDTGFSHNFAIREEDLLGWAGLDLRSLEAVGAARINGLPVKLLHAHVWLYRNQPGMSWPRLPRFIWNSSGGLQCTRAAPPASRVCPCSACEPCVRPTSNFTSIVANARFF
jgi:hypothetical protein